MAVMMTMLAAHAAHAQQPVSRAGEQFERVDEGVADLSPLSVSLRIRETGLHAATNFNQLFRVPGREDLLMRVDGGLYAVFDQSFYVQFPGGAFPVVPNNTVFHIGRPSLDTLGRTLTIEEPRVGLGAHQLLQINLVKNRVGPVAMNLSVDDEIAPEILGVRNPLKMNILTSRRYRAQRLRQLMGHAASAVVRNAEPQTSENTDDAGEAQPDADAGADPDVGPAGADDS